MQNMRHIKLLASMVVLMFTCPVHALITSFSASGTNAIAGTPPISFTYVSSPIGVTTGISPNSICAQVGAAYVGGGLFNNPSTLVCPGMSVELFPAALALSMATQTEIQAYTAANVVAIAALNGHGGQAWIVRTFFEMSPPTQQVIIHPIRVYGNTTLGIVVANETATINASAGAVVQVRANDTIGGRAANANNLTYTITNAGGLSGLTFNNTTGHINIPAGQTRGGATTIGYRACQAVTVTTNCVDGAIAATVTNVFIPIILSAIDDSATFTSDGGVLNVIANDRIDGLSVSPAQINIQLLSAGGLTGVSVDSQGQLRVPPQTVGGTFQLRYSVCEIFQGSCAQAGVTITILRPTILAVADAASITTAGGRINVLANDRVDNTAATLGSVNLALINNGGIAGAVVSAESVVIPSGVAAGQYSLSLQICERGVANNCSSAILSVTVTSIPVAAVDDIASIMASGGVITILQNDSVAGLAATSANADVTLIDRAGLSTIATNNVGEITVSANTTPGRYRLIYRLCQRGTMICENANVDLTVLGNVVAVDDIGVLPIEGGLIQILLNDRLNLNAPNLSLVDVTILVSGGLVANIDAAGRLVISRAVAGTYTLRYQLCQRSTTNCASANVTVTVLPTVTAVNTIVTLPATGGSVSLAANISVNGQVGAPNSVDFTLTANAGVSAAVINADGQLIVPAGLVAGRYVFSYQACQRQALAANCVAATVTVEISVTRAAFSNTNSRVVMPPGGGSVDLLASNLINTVRPNLSDVTVSLVSNANIQNLTIAASGNLIVPAGLREGAYQPTYRLCQRQLPMNCVEGTVFITITQSVTTATTNRPPSVPGAVSNITSVTLIGGGGAPITFSSNVSSNNLAGAITDPLTFSDVRLVFGRDESGKTEAFYAADETFDVFGAQLNYSGAGILRGRWEIVYPGDRLPSEVDLFPEAGLPISLRLQQQRYFQLERVQTYLSPTGRYFLTGPDPAKLPRNIPGQYLILLRIEATSAGNGLENGRAAFAFPVLRYTVFAPRTNDTDPSDAVATYNNLQRPLNGSGANVAQFSAIGEIPRGAITMGFSSMRPALPGQGLTRLGPSAITLMLPIAGARISRGVVVGIGVDAKAIEFSWGDVAGAASIRVELQTQNGKPILSANVAVGVGRYLLPAIVMDDIANNGQLRWRVRATNAQGKLIGEADWRQLTIE